MRVSLLYNLREEFSDARRRTPDSDADWDEPETVTALTEGLLGAGYEVADLGDPHQLLDPEVRASTDLVFNFCEMHGLRHREAIVPAICEFFQLPYAFSPPDAMIAALDKNLANLLVRQVGGYVPDWLLIREPSAPNGLRALLAEGPVIVKPVAEGAGMGISAAAIADTETLILERIKYVLSTYRQPAIVQRLACGPELTVAVLETSDGPTALQPIEVTDPEGGPLPIYGYEEKERASACVRWHTVADDRLTSEAQRLALLAFDALCCRDAARIDMRHDPSEGSLGFLEANPLPHLHPEVGDFCRSALAAGWAYRDLLEEIIASAMRRHTAYETERTR